MLYDVDKLFGDNKDSRPLYTSRHKANADPVEVAYKNTSLLAFSVKQF